MILYKYYPDSSNSFKAISVNGFWCAKGRQMNDPFESLGVSKREFTKEQLNSFRTIISESKASVITNEINILSDLELVRIINDYRDELINRYAFCSFSETKDDVLMWSHYASSHKGFVIGYEFDKAILKHHLQKVNYCIDNIPDLDVLKFASFFAGDDNGLDYVLGDVSLKSIQWEYEKEWRIWQRNEGYMLYSADKIKEIYFGVKCNAETKSIVLKLIPELDADFNVFEMEQARNPIRLIY